MNKETQSITPKIDEVINARHEFNKSYCEKKGWNMSKLDINQIMEIRSQPEWIEAGKKKPD